MLLSEFLAYSTHSARVELTKISVSKRTLVINFIIRRLAQGYFLNEKFLMIYGSMFGVIALVTYIGNTTLSVIFTTVVLIGVVLMSIGGGGGSGDGGMDGHNH